MQDRRSPTDGAGHRSSRLADSGIGVDVFVEWQLSGPAPRGAPIGSRGDVELVVLVEAAVRTSSKA
jgi:hypothetical protein